MKLYVGTSGYSYNEWKGNFYPEDIKSKDMLKYYAKHFSTVEINNTFYRIPRKEVFENWKGQVPSKFRFILKAPQLITHIKRLKIDTKDTVEYFTKVSSELGDKRGVVLFQLPPSFKFNLERLKDFIDIVPTDLKCAFEFRHPDWFNNEAYDLLKKRNFALCLSDTDEEPVQELINTADWSYLRLRRINYTKKNLTDWHKKIADHKWKEAYIFFKHEDEGKGPEFAKKFIELKNN
ncbi:MAG: DUF72 domain-containing protein [Ignavibacteriales bacterium]|nr:MAG: DUF72 domain-containing protein [Ignavibacteriales bacterium]